MVLFTSQWAGSSIKSHSENGARVLQELFREQYPSIPCVNCFPEALEEGFDFLGQENIKDFKAYYQTIQDMSTLLNKQKPEKILHIGGGCALDIPVISSLKSRFPDLMVLWFDAHGDLHTPETSASGYIHGMALGLLLHQNYWNNKPVLHPGDVYLAYTKELDGPERHYIESNQISIYNSIGQLKDFLNSTGENRPVFIHIDFDVFDPVEVLNLKCEVKSGIKLEEMVELLQMPSINPAIKGISLLENVDGRKEIFRKLFQAVSVILV